MSHIATEFGTVIPAKVTIPENQEKIIVANTINTSEIVLEKNARLTFVAVAAKGNPEKQFLNFHFDGEGAELNMITLLLGTDDQEFNFETISNHHVPRTNAYYYVRGAMFDKSKAYYKGILKIEKPAQITDTYLSHHSLMLSPDAKVETIPSLEIEADDVKAGHAATIGKIDEELLFYCGARGIDTATAQSMLIKGFIEADLKRIPDPAARAVVKDQLETALQNMV